MSLFSLRSLEGELDVNHQASPGLTAEQARQAGYGEGHQHELLGEGKTYRTPTMGCCHCGGCVVLNPARTRHRNHCIKCNAYICDWCHAATRDPDYQHRSFKEIADMIRSGRWRFAGGSMSNPVLLPVIGDNNG